MSIIYALIARDKHILAEYTEYRGNFEHWATMILKKVESNSRTIFKADNNYLFDIINDGQLTYMSLRDVSYPEETAFAFLESIMTEFSNTYTSEVIQSALGYSLNATFQEKIKEKMLLFNEDMNRNKDNIAKLKDGLNDSQNAILENIEELSMRGEKFQLIVSKAEGLKENAQLYVSRASKAKRAAQMRNRKIIIASVLLVLVIIFSLTTVICGGFSWPNCVS